jgi:pyruvate/2-oxoglutarate dehydrogenase complex dihydrolipoamide dehydrogenase (E3) component
MSTALLAAVFWGGFCGSFCLCLSSIPAQTFFRKASPAQKLPDLSQGSFPPVKDIYDLVVLGVGPAGETAAVRAAQLGASVAVIEAKRSFGGPTGLTSKAVREAAMQIAKAVDQVGGDRRRQISRMWKRRFPALRGEAEVMQAAETRDHLKKYGIDLFVGSAELVPAEDSLSGELCVRVCRATGCAELPAKKICIATGSRPNRPAELKPGVDLPFTRDVVIDATEMGQLTDLPKAAAILGGGVIAVEYATVLAKLGVGVSLICSESGFLPFLAKDLRDSLRERMARERVLFLDAGVKRIDVGNDGLARVLLEDKPRMPKRLRVDLVLFSGGRNANSESLNCPAVGVTVGRYGRIEVDDQYRTANPDIFAVGDVIGGGLASTAQQHARSVSTALFEGQVQYRLAQSMLDRSSAFEDALSDDWMDDEGFDGFDEGEQPAPSSSSAPSDKSSTLFGDGAKIAAPLTLWTIPPCASVGASEEQAREAGLTLASEPGGRLVIGKAFYKDMARGRLTGDQDGWLKIVASANGPGSHSILGVQIFGDSANELIQLGSILVHSKATLEQVSNTPWAGTLFPPKKCV